MKRLSLVLLALSLFASTAAAQSLADVARQEAERRKAVKTPSKVYTDADLRKVVPATPASAAQPAAAPATPPEGAAPPAPPKDATAKDEKGEAWWQARIAAARSKLARAKLQYDAMQTRINSLTNDWAARDNPIERQQLAQERANAMAEQQRLKDDMDALTKEIADIQEEARRAGVPPGWVR